jgi:hypothetical protein
MQAEFVTVAIHFAEKSHAKRDSPPHEEGNLRSEITNFIQSVVRG